MSQPGANTWQTNYADPCWERDARPLADVIGAKDAEAIACVA